MSMLSQIIFCDLYLFLIIYINLAIEVKLFLDQKIAQIIIQNARVRLLRFYDIIFIYIDFIKVNKTQFKELNDRYRNKRKKGKQFKNDQILKNCFILIETFSKASART